MAATTAPTSPSGSPPSLDRRQDARPVLVPVRRLDVAGHRARRGGGGPGARSISRAWPGCSCSASRTCYLIWWGDILTLYALVGMVAFLFARMRAEQLFAAAHRRARPDPALEQLGPGLARKRGPRDTPSSTIQTWDPILHGGSETPPPDWIARAKSPRCAAPWLGPGRAAAGIPSTDPFAFVKPVGPETLAAMLFGMAA